jgi:hypothetical protein
MKLRRASPVWRSATTATIIAVAHQIPIST